MHEIITKIRWMTPSDMRQIIKIENFNSPHWEYQDFKSHLKHERCAAMVAEYNSKVVGFLIYESDKEFVHVLNIGVHPEYRRATIGSQLLAKLLPKIVKKKIIDCIVHERNIGLQFFLKENYHGYS